jgi:hypothetical protein
MPAQVVPRGSSAPAVAVDLALNPASPLRILQCDALRLEYADAMFLPELLNKAYPTVALF